MPWDIRAVYGTTDRYCQRYTMAVDGLHCWVTTEDTSLANEGSLVQHPVSEHRQLSRISCEIVVKLRFNDLRW